MIRAGCGLIDGTGTLCQSCERSPQEPLPLASQGAAADPGCIRPVHRFTDRESCPFHGKIDVPLDVDRDRFSRPMRRPFALFILFLVVGSLAVAEGVLSALPDAAVARTGERPFAPPRALLLREYQPNAH